jgi:dTDP-4-amino-4,6-dideoxygalactose transaminase
MNIPCLDIHRQYLSLKSEVLAKTEEVFDTNAFSGGPFVEQFEKDFATFCESEYALGCNNGTTALHLALLTLGIQAGDGRYRMLARSLFLLTMIRKLGRLM